MAMPATAGRWTAEMVRALPDDGKRYEVIAGELLVTPAPMPRHQLVQMRLIGALLPYVERTREDLQLLASPADISWDEDTLVQPDLFVVPKAEVSNDWLTFRTLLLAVEIVSPSSARADRVLKRRLYQAQHVGAYWIVDVEAAVVEVWRPGDERPEVVTDVLRWRVGEPAAELSIPLAELFADLPS